MLRKDYLLRQVEMLSALVARLLHLRQIGDEQGATDEIEQSYQELFGFDPHLINLLPADFLLDKLRSGEYLDADKGITLALLLREDAMNYQTAGDAVQHFQRMARSLKVFLAVEREHQLAPEQAALYSVDDALAQLDEYELPADLKYDLFQYHEDNGQFAQAEDVLHELIIDTDGDAQVVDEGIAFYEWLLTLDDAELDTGNLPRAEVEESLAALRARGQ
jgi:hypothetical protein